MICFTSCSFFSFISFLIFFLFLIHRLFCHLNFFVIYFLTTFCSHHRVVVVAWSFKDGVSEIVELRILDRDEIHFPLNLLSRFLAFFLFLLFNSFLSGASSGPGAASVVSMALPVCKAFLSVSRLSLPDEVARAGASAGYSSA
jgi:hypothetical protein